MLIYDRDRIRNFGLWSLRWDIGRCLRVDIYLFVVSRVRVGSYVFGVA